jgi:hypothetical protein
MVKQIRPCWDPYARTAVGHLVGGGLPALPSKKLQGSARVGRAYGWAGPRAPLSRANVARLLSKKLFVQRADKKAAAAEIASLGFDPVLQQGRCIGEEN